MSWENEKSFSFVAFNGVKQGGVLSPILYGIYDDLLLTMLKESGNGCYVGCTFGTVQQLRNAFLWDFDPSSPLRNAFQRCVDHGP